MIFRFPFRRLGFGLMALLLCTSGVSAQRPQARGPGEFRIG